MLLFGHYYNLLPQLKNKFEALVQKEDLHGFFIRNIFQLNFQFSFPKTLLLLCQFGYYKGKEFDVLPSSLPQRITSVCNQEHQQALVSLKLKNPPDGHSLLQVFSLDLIWLKQILPLSFIRLLVISGLWSQRGKDVMLIEHLFCTGDFSEHSAKIVSWISQQQPCKVNGNTCFIEAHKSYVIRPSSQDGNWSASLPFLLHVPGQRDHQLLALLHLLQAIYGASLLEALGGKTSKCVLKDFVALEKEGV